MKEWTMTPPQPPKKINNKKINSISQKLKIISFLIFIKFNNVNNSKEKNYLQDNFFISIFFFFFLLTIVGTDTPPKEANTVMLVPEIEKLCHQILVPFSKEYNVQPCRVSTGSGCKRREQRISLLLIYNYSL